MRTKHQQTFSEADKAAWRAAKQQRLTDLGDGGDNEETEEAADS